jgi:UDP-2-acetamido-2,6-beta-L-arabino-hexul-4-ose reductase
VTVAVTGAEGFLGWHLSCRLAATRGSDPVRLGRAALADPTRLRSALAGVDTVYHLAGVNRAATDDEVEQGNVALARAVAEALGGRPVHVVYADSIQRDLDNAYGRGKRGAAEVLDRLPGTRADVVLPNLFGEHGRPAYNSFVATFCHEIAAGRQPEVHEDRSVPLLHAQAGAEALIAAGERRETHRVEPAGEPHGVAEVRDLLVAFHGLYAGPGDVPDLSTPFARDLFNTYRSYLFPAGYPIHPPVHADQRGDLVEAVRSHGGTGQAFVSTTVPGAMRGDHYHLHKVERFMVVRGEAEIALRRLYHDEVVRFRVSGTRPGFVDMPTLWVHHIRNVGDDELVTVFWADQLLDREHPDQYPLKVEDRP